MMIEPNIENASHDSSLPTRNLGAESLRLSHWMQVSTSAPTAMATVVHAYARLGHTGVSAAPTSNSSPPPSIVSSGDSANQSIDGATKSAPITAGAPLRSHRLA